MPAADAGTGEAGARRFLLAMAPARVVGADAGIGVIVASWWGAGSSRTSWPNLAAFARAHDQIFIPCVGPGYCDTGIRP
jgi:hypothetical protein